MSEEKKSKLQKKREQLSKLEAEIAALEAEEELAVAIDRLDTNDVVRFTFGRAANRQTLTGTVLGTQSTDKGKRIRVFIGSGVDADIKTIQPSDIVEVRVSGESYA